MIRNRLAVFLINVGIRVLPKEFRNERLIKNMMKTGHIKIEK